MARHSLGSAWSGSAPQHFLLAGGRTARDLEIGSGPVRLHTSTEVRDFQVYLAKVDDHEIRSRFDPCEMANLEIYPEIWDRPPEEDDTLGYLMEYVAMLRDFIDTAVSRGMGVAISLT